MKRLLPSSILTLLVLVGCQGGPVAPPQKPGLVTAFTTVGTDGRRVKVAEDCSYGGELLDRMSAKDAPQEIWSFDDIEVVLSAAVEPSRGSRAVTAFTTITPAGERITLPPDSLDGMKLLDRMDSPAAPQEIWALDAQSCDPWTIEIVLATRRRD